MGNILFLEPLQVSVPALVGAKPPHAGLDRPADLANVGYGWRADLGISGGCVILGSTAESGMLAMKSATRRFGIALLMAATCPSVVNGASLTAAQNATRATLASAGCLMLQISRTYDPATSEDELASKAERACDAEVIELGRARAAAGADKTPQTEEQSRQAGTQLANMLILQIRSSDASKP